MSEYWVSHKKYFCKYCNIYISDDAPSRRQHETGLRHKGNVERFVRGLYKEGEKRKQDREEEKREMARIEQAARSAFAQDVGAGLVRPGSSSEPVASTSSAPARKPAAKPSDPYANYTTAESLGYTDPDAERMEAEAERRRTQGVVGEWEVITVAESSAPADADEAEAQPSVATGDNASRKREAEQPPDEEDTRWFKLRRRTVGVGLGEIYDPGLIPIKVKKKEEPVDTIPSGTTAPEASTSTDASAATSERPKWSARGWNKPGESRGDEEQSLNQPSESASPSSEVKPEGVELQIKEEGPVLGLDTGKAGSSVKVEDVEVKTEASVEAVLSTGLFRKRKLPAGGAGSRGRRA